MARRNTKNQTTKAQAEVRRQRCLELRVAGLSCAQIGREVGIDESTAARHVREALAELATMKLDEAERILARHHVKVSGGNVVRDLDPATGQLVVIEDDGPAMTAIGRLQSLYESRRKLLGLDAPAKVEQSGEVKVVVEYADAD
jgi:DNA-binding CsgD family transcriptional regulator